MDSRARQAFKEELRELVPDHVYECIEARDDIMAAIARCEEDPRGCNIEDLKRVLKLLDDVLMLKLDVETHQQIREQLYDSRRV